jgi:hypothetical protein
MARKQHTQLLQDFEVEHSKTMEDDELMQFIDVQDQVKNRQLPYGETISPCTCLTGIGITPVIDVEVVIHIVEFPATISPLLGETTMDEFHIFTEKLIFDVLLPLAKDNFNMMSAQKPRSLCRELQRSPIHLAASFFPQNQR